MSETTIFLLITLLPFSVITFVLYFYIFYSKSYRPPPILEKNYLDLAANQYNIKRMPDETDQDFRIRILNILTRIG